LIRELRTARILGYSVPERAKYSMKAFTAASNTGFRPKAAQKLKTVAAVRWKG
jgi:hypothetical protein